MLLTIDLGNTSLKLAIFDQENKIAANVYDEFDNEYGALIKNFLYRNNVSEKLISDCVVSSVIPSASKILLSELRRILNKEPIFIDSSLPIGISIDTPNPEEVGSDLLSMSSYAYNLYKDELLVVSIGTATVICHITKDGEFKHCIISPGYGKIAQSLWGNAAKLPEFKQTKTDTFLANTTVDAMNVGLYQGYIGSLKYLINGIKKELNINPKIVACGGFGKEIVKDIDDIEYYETDMVTSGLHYIYWNYLKNETDIG